MLAHPIPLAREKHNPLRYLWGISLFLGLGLTLLFINLCQTLSLVILPFSRRRFKQFNRMCAWTFWSLCVFWLLRLPKVRIKIDGDPIPTRENAMVISNHQEMPDILMIMYLASEKARIGDLKFFVKAALKKVPGIGWGMQFLDCPFVKRNWGADADGVGRVFSSLLKTGFPFWVVSFSEGTRIRPEKLKSSQAFAKRAGYPVFNYVLVPRTRGFVAAMESLRHSLDAVYDVTIGYPDGVPRLSQVFLGELKEVHLHVRRFAVASLPEGRAELEDWVVERFREKDGWMERFVKRRTVIESPALELAPT